MSGRVITRRAVLGVPGVALALMQPRPLVVPVHRVMNRWARCSVETYQRFWFRIWPEAVRDFGRGGVELQCTDRQGEIKQMASGKPLFSGIERGVLNVVLTDQIPAYWDEARSLAGISGFYGGYALCVIAMNNAHGDRIPFLSTNTCVHEMLHVLMQDVFGNRSKWYQSSEHEARVDWYATQLWLFGNGAAVRRSAADAVKRLQT